MNASLDHAPADAEAIALRLSALAHPARLSILKHLACADACCCKDVVERLDLAQSTVSQHLRILVDAGLVRYAPDRPRSRYSLDRPALAGLQETVSDLLSACCAPPPGQSGCHRE